jgi:hypothetical protein
MPQATILEILETADDALLVRIAFAAHRSVRNVPIGRAVFYEPARARDYAHATIRNLRDAKAAAPSGLGAESYRASARRCAGAAVEYALKSLYDAVDQPPQGIADRIRPWHWLHGSQRAADYAGACPAAVAAYHDILNTKIDQ